MLSVLGYEPEVDPTHYIVYNSGKGICERMPKTVIKQLLLNKNGKPTTDALLLTRS
jgi:hypothetical protein